MIQGSAVIFLLPSPESASCPLEREAWPRNSESPFTNSRSFRPTFSKNITSTNRSIRGLGPPPGCYKACGAKSGASLSAAISARTESAANSESHLGGGRQNRRQFPHPEIAHTARRETAYREIGALSTRNGWRRTCSRPCRSPSICSRPGDTHPNAPRVICELLPAFTGAARQLLFEHSPGRGNLKFKADHTAFDALIRYSDGPGRTASSPSRSNIPRACASPCRN